MRKKLWMISVVLATLLGACQSTSSSSSDNTETSSQTNLETDTILPTSIRELVWTQEDLKSTYMESSVTRIEFGSTISVKGEGASVKGNVLTIIDEGDYLLSGSSTNAQIIVSADAQDNVHLIMDGLEIINEKGSPFVVVQADKVIVTLQENSMNRLQDAVSYLQTEEEPNAVLFSADDLTINGTGSLELVGLMNHGIYVKDDLRIRDATITITSANDGLKGKDAVWIENATLNIVSGGDGIQSNNAESTELGTIVIVSGTYTIKAQDDAIQAENTLEIQGGSFNLSSGLSNDTEASGKGLKAVLGIYVSGGEFTIVANDDAVHSNAWIQIDSGSFTINTQDDGIHADSLLVLNGGSIDVRNAYEGLESAHIILNEGSVHLVTDDDGVNASSGSSQNNDMFASDGSSVEINGGTLILSSDGDGLDSNGGFTMTGGTVIVFGPTNDGNGSLDYNENFTITGGILLALGSSGMAQQPNAGTQNTVLINFAGVDAGETVSLVDDAGNIIVSVQALKAFNSFVYSSSALVNGTYTLVQSGDVSAQYEYTVAYSGKLSGGTVLENVTISSTQTQIGQTMMGPGMNGTKPNGQKPSRN